MLKRNGFASKAEAKAAVDRVNELLGLAGADDNIRARLGDMIVSATRNGGRLPEVADIRRRVGAGADPAAPAATFEQAWQAWLSGKKRLRQSARERLDQVGQTWLIPVLADVPVERLNPGHCAAVFERIDRINAEIAARSDGSRAYVHVDSDVRSRGGRHAARLDPGGSDRSDMAWSRLRSLARAGVSARENFESATQ